MVFTDVPPHRDDDELTKKNNDDHWECKGFQSIYNPVQPRVNQAEESWLKKYQIHDTILFACKIFFVWYQDQEECHIPTFELMLTFDFSEQNAHTIWQEYGDRDRYVNWILQTQKVQIFMSAGCVQNKSDLYPQRGNIWKSPPLVSSALKARLRYERTWSKASLAKAGWFRHIHRDANLSCSSSTHLPWFNIVTQPSLWDAPKEFRCLQVTVVFRFFSGSLFLGFTR